MKYGILGAGSIGCYVGGMLAAAGNEVILTGRQTLVEETRLNGLTLIAPGKEPVNLDSSKIYCSADPLQLAGCDVVLVCVKSGDTAAAAGVLSPLPAGILIVSLQNGISNVRVLTERLGNRPITGSMVPYNVVREEKAVFRCTIEGEIVIDRQIALTDRVVDDFQKAGLPARLSKNLPAIQRGKLIINLNNAVNALSGLPLREQLADKHFRKIMAAVMKEGLRILDNEGLGVSGSGSVMPRLSSLALELPDFIFTALASFLVPIDEHARSSMWDDLKRGRKTEVEYINGEIVRIARRSGLKAPLQSGLIDLVHRAERSGQGSPGMNAQELADALGMRL